MNHTITSLPILVIHAHSRCNCRCAMCDIWKTTENAEFSLAQLDTHLPAMRRLGVQWVVFTGGEPLMHSSLFELARRLRAELIKVTILSTGLLLERYASEIAETIDEVIVSLDGPEPIHEHIRRTPGCFTLLSCGIRALPSMRIAARCTVQRANHDRLLDTVESARNIGLASLSFLAADISSSAFGRDLVWPMERQNSVALTESQTDTLAHEIETLIAHNDGFVIDRPEHLRRIVSHFRGSLGLEPHRSPRCNAPWKSAVLEISGDIRPCFFHPVLGSANEGLEVALNSPNSQSFREHLDIESNPICQQCVCSLYVDDPALGD